MEFQLGQYSRHSAHQSERAISNYAIFNLGTTDPWTLASSNQTLSQAPNDDTYTGQTFDLTGQTAIRVDSSYLGTGIGLGKVRFEGTLVPEPAAALLGSLGLLAHLRRRRNREWLVDCDPMQVPLEDETGWAVMERMYFNL